MQVNIWNLFVDLGLISILILLSVILRAKIILIQKLFLPASLIAGVLGLILGPNGLNFLPFSQSIGQYPGVLIALVFGALPLVAPKLNVEMFKNRIGGMWAYSTIIALLQWGLGLFFALLILKPFWNNLPDGFGLVLASGFLGGHGTAAAVGDVFALLGREDFRSLAMTSATIGVLCSIIIGIPLIKSGANKGESQFITSFSHLPNALRTGLISKKERTTSELNTFSSIVIDPFVVHLALVCSIVFCGFVITKGIALINPHIVLPVFSIAFLVGLLIKKILNVTKASDYISKPIIERISGSSTDLLVAFGISSINLSVVMDNFIPLLLLLVFGLFFCYFCFRILSKKFFKTFYFEKGIFSWGWSTGTVAMGIALLRIVDPDAKTGTLEDFGLAYIVAGPIEILTVTFAPVLVAMNFSYIFVGITCVASAIIYIMAKKLNWLAVK